MTLLDALPWAVSMLATGAALWFLGAYLRESFAAEKARADLHQARRDELETAARLRAALAESQAAQCDTVDELELVNEIERRSFHSAVCVAWKKVPLRLPSSMTANMNGNREMVLAMLQQAHFVVYHTAGEEPPDQSAPPKAPGTPPPQGGPP